MKFVAKPVLHCNIQKTARNHSERFLLQTSVQLEQVFIGTVIAALIFDGLHLPVEDHGFQHQNGCSFRDVQDAADLLIGIDSKDTLIDLADHCHGFAVQIESGKGLSGCFGSLCSFIESLGNGCFQVTVVKYNGLVVSVTQQHQPGWACIGSVQQYIKAEIGAVLLVGDDPCVTGITLLCQRFGKGLNVNKAIPNFGGADKAAFSLEGLDQSVCFQKLQRLAYRDAADSVCFAHLPLRG